MEGVLKWKCGGIVSLDSVWRNAACKLLGGAASESYASMLLERFRSARNLGSLVAGLAREGQTVDAFVESLLSAVDESSFGLESWILSFELVQDSLVEQNRSAKPSSIMGYVQCTAEFASQAGTGGPLPDLVGAMLAEHGFDGEEGCQTPAPE